MRVTIFLSLALLGLTACGSDDSDSSGNGGNGASSSSGQGGTAGSGGDAGGGNGQGGTGQGGSSQGGSGQGGMGNGGNGQGGGSFACGDMGLSCSDEDICVAFHATMGPMTTTTYACHEDPCTPMPLSCACAGQICADQFNVEICDVDTDNVVNCDNGAVCAAPDTPIATPHGERSIASLRPGDLVYSMHRGKLVVVPIERVSKHAVTEHAVVRAQLDNGATLLISGPHPTAEGKLFSELSAGSRLGEATVVSVATLPYPYDSTHDILPASDSGSYLAAGALIGSTLR